MGSRGALLAIEGSGPLDWGILANSIGPRLRLLRNMLNARSIAVSEPFGLPTGALTVMALIARNPGHSQVELAANAGITGPGLVGIVDDLERRGLVQRTRSTVDRRRNMLVLSAQGEQAMTALFAEVRGIEEPIRQELTPEELAQFISFIERANAALLRAGAKTN